MRTGTRTRGYVADVDGRTSVIAPELAAWFGYSADALIGRRLSEVVGQLPGAVEPRVQEMAWAQLRGIASGELPGFCGHEWRITRADGSLWVCTYGVHRLRDGNGVWVGVTPRTPALERDPQSVIDAYLQDAAHLASHGEPAFEHVLGSLSVAEAIQLCRFAANYTVAEYSSPRLSFGQTRTLTFMRHLALTGYFDPDHCYGERLDQCTYAPLWTKTGADPPPS